MLNLFLNNLFFDKIIWNLKPEDRDFVIQKNTSGTFISVLISEVVTNFCIYTTAREAADYGFQVVLMEDCCAAWSPEIHEVTLKSFGLLTGFILMHEKVMKKMSIV
jgi:nicotinamidase-related amidase